MPYVGSLLPPFDTPTVDDHRGVEPYCTLHARAVPAARRSRSPRHCVGQAASAYMIGTPAHCQTGTCAPGSGVPGDEHERLGDAVAMVHADVYADDAATTVAPAVAALGLQYEPVIYLGEANGIVRRPHRRRVGSERARRAARRLLPRLLSQLS